MPYQNTGFESQSSVFTDVSNAVGPNTAIFGNQVKQAPIAGGLKQPMTNGSLTLNIPFSVPGAAGTRDSVLNKSLKLQWNIPYKDAQSLADLRVEVNRLLDAAIQSYNLTSGLVPAVSATFPVV